MKATKEVKMWVESYCKEHLDIMESQRRSANNDIIYYRNLLATSNNKSDIAEIEKTIETLLKKYERLDIQFQTLLNLKFCVI